MTKIKICGLRFEEDAYAANAAAPDYIGFIFVSDRRRYVTPETAEKLRKILNPQIPAVGVFIDEQPEVIADLARRGIIQIAQLHGSEDAAYLTALRALTDIPVFQAFQIRDAEDLERAMASEAELLLLDSGTGGGKTFDWSLLDSMGDRPYLLAGGLDAENVVGAISRCHPYGVDVSSGVETDGRKDPQKMKEFVKLVRVMDHMESEVLMKS